MNDEYEPDIYEEFPHRRYICEECEESVIVIGWEVEGAICTECGDVMEWAEDLHSPRV